MGLDLGDIINQTTLLASEYGVLIGAHVKEDFYHTMCELFDGSFYKETRRSLNRDIEIPSPFMTMLAGTQPTHWNITFPKESWGLGYASRCDFYFSDVNDADLSCFEDVACSMFNTEQDSNTLDSIVHEFAHDLQCLVKDRVDKIAQQLLMSKRAWEVYSEWYNNERLKTEFKDPWLLDYNSRRGFRLRRDMALCCLARGDENYEISEEDFNLAIKIFRKQELQLTTYFNKIRVSADADVALSTYKWVLNRYVMTRNNIPRSLLLEYIGNRVDSIHKAEKILEYLTQAGALDEHLTMKTKGGNEIPLSSPQYSPVPDWGDGVF